jgi:hypothetical protein
MPPMWGILWRVLKWVWLAVKWLVWWMHYEYIYCQNFLIE